MDLATTMKSLESAGSAQAKKVYARHGVKEPMYGVSYAALKTLAKKIGHDHVLARQLWETRNHDARILATMIADPKQTDSWLIDRWRFDLNNRVLTDALAGLADAADIACDQVNRWCEAGDESASAMGWGVLARRMARPGGWSDDDLARKIETIERTIHRSPNRARHAMNGALIAIGMRNAGLRKLALAAAERIGPVEVDHGETGCKTPDAAAYIMKGVEYQQSRAAGKIRSAQKPKTKSVRSTAAKRKKSKSAMVRR